MRFMSPFHFFKPASMDRLGYYPWFQASLGGLGATQTQTVALGKWALSSLSPRNVSSLPGKSFPFVLESGISLSSFVFFFPYRTPLWLGKDRGPSVWDILCWVSLFPRFIFSQMCFLRDYAALGHPQGRLHAPVSLQGFPGGEARGGFEFTHRCWASWSWLWSESRGKLPDDE